MLPLPAVFAIMMPWRQLVLVFVLVSSAGAIHAQHFFKTPCFTAQYFGGSFLTNQPKAQLLRDSYSYWGEVSIYKPTTGQMAWQQANGLPLVGMAIFFGNSGSKQYLGTMAGAFPFISWRFVQQRHFTSSIRAGAGIGFIQKPYHKIYNHKNVLIGTRTNAYLNVLWQTQVRLFSNLHANAGLSFSHFSNGSSTLPNLGLNIPALSIGISYVPAQSKQTSKKEKSFSELSQTGFAIYTSAGIKQAPWIESKRFVVNMAQGEWHRRAGRLGSYHGGVLALYNRSLKVDAAGILDRVYTGTKVQAGVYGGYQHQLGRLSIPVSVGAYVFNSKTGPALFQQVGFRYRLQAHWEAQLAMKTHGGKADFIHAGFGYTF